MAALINKYASEIPNTAILVIALSTFAQFSHTEIERVYLIICGALH